MQTFEDFLSECGVNDADGLISFLSNFDPIALSEKEKAQFEIEMDKVFEKISNNN